MYTLRTSGSQALKKGDLRKSSRASSLEAGNEYLGLVGIYGKRITYLELQVSRRVNAPRTNPSVTMLSIGSDEFGLIMTGSMSISEENKAG